MELRNKRAAQNVTNIKLNVWFCYKCIINVYVQLGWFAKSNGNKRQVNAMKEYLY